MEPMTIYGDQLKLIANISWGLAQPQWHQPNVGSRGLSLTEGRMAADWQVRYGHTLLLVETIVDP